MKLNFELENKKKRSPKALTLFGYFLLWFKGYYLRTNPVYILPSTKILYLTVFKKTNF